MPDKLPKYAWMADQLVPWDEATIHVQTPAFRYGAMVFEGIRGYWNPDQGELYLFRVSDHFQRLQESIKVMRMEMDWSIDPFLEPLMQLIKANQFQEDIHIRYMVYIGGAGPIYALGPAEVSIVCLASKRNYDIEKGISCSVSSWMRIRDNVIPPRVKCAANYQNGRLAVMQAKRDGYDYTLMLNEAGKLTETPTSCVFMVRKGRPVTPRITDGILESITRSTLISLFERELGLPVVEREIDRTELYVAEEVLICGSGAEVVPVVNIDGYSVGTGERGPLTKGIQESYFNVVRGSRKEYADWLTPVYRT
jgi:branched-chain amino acid aminotransferase